jgi:AmmeMemoRadiSam system protein B
LKKPEFKTRPPKCAGKWYPVKKQTHGFIDNPVSSAVISPHAGFGYSGMVSLEAVSHVKKNRIWIFGTSHYETPQRGISIYYGDYFSSIGKALFPRDLDEKIYSTIEKYLSDEGHRTEEHSIENVLYCVNHFKKDVNAFCSLIHVTDEEDLEKITDDITKVWKKDDSIIVSTDWNHFVSTKVIDKLMKEVSSYLVKGDIETLYMMCRKGELEACGMDGLYLAHKILSKVHENNKFKVFTATDSSKTESGSGGGLTSKTCVGYISAGN